jgi:ADP-heptose:LPS heptosyltransferase
MQLVRADFKHKIEDATSILVVNPRGLGDVIHSLPVAAMLKRTLPHAQVDLLVSTYSEDLFAIVPFVRRVLSVTFRPRPTSKVRRYGRRLKTAWRVRQNGYDAIINLQAIDSTSTVIALSRAPYKLAVRSIYSTIGMPWIYTDVVDRAWRNQSAHRFKLEALGDAGFAVDGWHLGPKLIDFGGQQTPQGVTTPFFHFSPCAAKTSRQLPSVESRALITNLLRRYPTHQVVLSCSAARREVDEIRSMIMGPMTDRIKVFAGTLTLAQLAVLLAHADAHIGPDTGSLHLAWLVGAKTVSWFLNHESVLAWVPYGPQHRVLLSLREQVRIGDNSPEAETVPIQAIKVAHILEALDDLLQTSLPAREQWWSSSHLGFRCIY